MIQGITSHDLRLFEGFLIKANEEQLTAMQKEIDTELFKRSRGKRNI